MLLAFTRLGLNSFGGPVAHRLLRAEERRRVALGVVAISSFQIANATSVFGSGTSRATAKLASMQAAGGPGSTTLVGVARPQLPDQGGVIHRSVSSLAKLPVERTQLAHERHLLVDPSRAHAARQLGAPRARASFRARGAIRRRLADELVA